MLVGWDTSDLQYVLIDLKHMYLQVFRHVRHIKLTTRDEQGF